MMQSSTLVTVKSADRVFDLLELLCSSGHPMTHAEIAMALSIPKSSLSQLLHNLERRGYVAFTAGPDTYELGPAIATLAQGAKSNSLLLKVAQNTVDVLSKTTQETASFYKLRGKEVERVTVTNAQRPLRYWMRVGEAMPIHATSGGKVILAALAAADRERILAEIELSKVTSRTITSRAALSKELQSIAKTGIAYSRGEFEEGVIGISVVVMKPNGRPEGSLSVVLPEARNKPAHRKVIIDALLGAKARLEAEISRTPDDPGARRKNSSRQK